MPVIKLTRNQKIKDAMKRLTRECNIDCMDYKIRRKDIADVLGLTPETITYQFSKERISMETYLTIQLLKEEKIARIKADADAKLKKIKNK